MTEQQAYHPTKLGRYEIRGIQGRGAMGVVYRAYDTRIARPVALKVVQKMDLDHHRLKDMLTRFMGEARAAGRLMHPNIVSIFDFDENADAAYIAMELIEGTDLKSYLEQRAPIPVPRALAITRQLLDALAYSHVQGVIHRDIKPANVFVLKNGNVKLGDFGIAKLVSGADGVTMDGSVMGTPSYMSPEHLAGDAMDGRADLFSLGVMLYEMLTGSKPFSGDIPSILNQILNTDPTPPSTVNPALPASLDTVLGKALAKRPEARYQTAADFRAALERALSDGTREQDTLVLTGTFARDRPPGGKAGDTNAEPTLYAAPVTGTTRSFVVSPWDKGDFRSVAEAVRHAAPHDRILLEPGDYEESLYIDKPLLIAGKGVASEVRLLSRTFQVLKVASDKVRIRNLTIRGQDPSGHRPAVVIRRGKVLFEDCDISAESDLCVSVQGGGSQPHFRSCRIHDSKGVGIHFSAGSGGQVENCSIFGNPKGGIVIDRGAHPQILGGQLRDAVIGTPGASPGRQSRHRAEPLGSLWCDTPEYALKGLAHGAWIGAVAGALLLGLGIGSGVSLGGLAAGLVLGFWQQRLGGAIVGFVVALLFVPLEIPASAAEFLVRQLSSLGVPAAQVLIGILDMALRSSLIGALTLVLGGALGHLMHTSPD